MKAGKRRTGARMGVLGIVCVSVVLARAAVCAPLDLGAHEQSWDLEPWTSYLEDSANDLIVDDVERPPVPVHRAQHGLVLPIHQGGIG
jgi:hypothetical protein